MTDWQDWNNPQEESRREMARPLAFSAVFHLLVVLAFAIGWPFLSDREPLAQPLVIIDMVDIVPDTNLQSAPPLEEKQAAPAEEKPAPKIEKASSLTPPPPPPPAPAPPPPPPPPPPPAPTPPPPPPPPAPAPEAPAKAEILPDKKIAAPVPRPKARPATPQPTRVAAPQARPKPPKRPEKKQPARENKLAKKSQQKQKRDEALTGVLQNLAKAQAQRQVRQEDDDRKKKASQTLNEALAKAASKPKPKPEPEKKPDMADLSKAVQKAAKDPAKDRADEKPARKTDLATVSQAVQQAVRAPQPVRPQKMGINELDRLRNHIAGCWQPPVAAPGAEGLKVDILVQLERDGSVREASIQDARRYRSDRFFKVAADAALRAVLECSPLPLPAEKFDLWKEFIFGFDPRFIAG